MEWCRGWLGDFIFAICQEKIPEKNVESRAICYASHSLSQEEHCYNQKEKEALASVWVCEHFHLYLYELLQFDLVTDHEAIKVIYLRKSKPSARLEGWVLHLQLYYYQFAEALAGLTKIPASDQSMEDDGYVCRYNCSSTCCPCCIENQRD